MRINYNYIPSMRHVNQTVLKIRIYFAAYIEIVNAGSYPIFFLVCVQCTLLDLSERTSTDDERSLQSKHFHFRKAGLTLLSRSNKNYTITYRFPIKSLINIKYQSIYTLCIYYTILKNYPKQRTTDSSALYGYNSYIYR